MRMFRLPTWRSEPRGNDTANGEESVFAKVHATMRSAAQCNVKVNMDYKTLSPNHLLTSGEKREMDVVENHASARSPTQENEKPPQDLFNSLSKRTWDHDVLGFVTQDEPNAKRLKSNSLADSAVDMGCDNTPTQETKVEEDTAAAAEMIDQMREGIESQFSLEILCKHQELRLINQELAKCQVAMEQLRRCHLIPYPTSQSTPEAMINISNGTGPAVGYAGEKVAYWAAPHGVTDGPYSRHYAKWLIPDPKFGDQEWPHGSRAGKTVEGRSTRHSHAHHSTYASSTPRARTSGQGHQQLSSGYALPKEKPGPCVLTRSDGQTVKLVCINCQREDFASIQGFINHCRISHQREFKSHEQAAMASGQPIERDEVSGVVAEDKTPSTATGLVHPFITAAPTSRDPCASILSHITASLKLYEQGNLPGVSSIPSSTQTSPLKSSSLGSTMQANSGQSFVPSTEAPYLSKLMQTKGFGGNLTDLVGEAKEKLEIDEVSQHDDESEDEAIPVYQGFGGLDGAASPVAPMRMVARAPMLPLAMARPVSSKGMDGRKLGMSPRGYCATPVINTVAANYLHSQSSTHLIDGHHDDFDTQHDVDADVGMMNLSPNTIASNNAPSLVSDDDDDEGDDVDSASEAEEEEGSDVAEIDFRDIEDGELGKVVSRTGIRKDTSNMRKENNAVTFVSPVKEKERPTTVL